MVKLNGTIADVAHRVTVTEDGQTCSANPPCGRT